MHAFLAFCHIHAHLQSNLIYTHLTHIHRRRITTDRFTLYNPPCFLVLWEKALERLPGWPTIPRIPASHLLPPALWEAAASITNGQTNAGRKAEIPSTLPFSVVNAVFSVLAQMLLLLSFSKQHHMTKNHLLLLPGHMIRLEPSNDLWDL